MLHIVKQIFKRVKDHHKLDWLELNTIEEYISLISSNSQAKDSIALFKHSTRCSISSLAKRRLESDWGKLNPEIPIYLIDLIQYRELSDFIASNLAINHQSPQVILLVNGKPKYNTSHLSISSTSIAKHK